MYIYRALSVKDSVSHSHTITANQSIFKLYYVEQDLSYFKFISVSLYYLKQELGVHSLVTVFVIAVMPVYQMPHSILHSSLNSQSYFSVINLFQLSR